jgi:sugar transferase (PEP-CTERM/EpsH1 system associated)
MTTMTDFLYLTHRLPYPPHKGEKVHAYELLKFLKSRGRVFLGTFVDDPHDEQYVETVRGMCDGLHVERIEPRFAKLKSLVGLLTGEALSVRYYRNEAMQAWVARTVREQGIKTAVVFSAQPARFVLPLPDLRLIVDFSDLDSAKWTAYANEHLWPMSWLYRREGRLLLDFERSVAERAEVSFFVTDAEVALFRKLVPDFSGQVQTMSCGVDFAYFNPEFEAPSPFPEGEIPLVFTGVMDYLPNVDAVTWFVREMLPELRRRHPRLRFYVVGMRPAPVVEALAGENVVVTGRVPDVRPYLKGAAVVVAPLRVARGIQTKVLDAMAMARPVVVAESCAGPIDAEPGRHFETAADAAAFIERIEALLRDKDRAEAMGRAAREQVIARYSWRAHLEGLGRYLEPARPADAREGVALGAG